MSVMVSVLWRISCAMLRGKEEREGRGVRPKRERERLKQKERKRERERETFETTPDAPKTIRQAPQNALRENRDALEAFESCEDLKLLRRLRHLKLT